MGHTFISYAREDRAKANAIASALEAAGVEAWLDERLRAGSEFDAAIERALTEATKVIVLWSPASTDSRWVRAEAGDGLDRGILVPVMVEPTKVPLEFRRIQALDLTKWDGDPNAADLAELVVTIMGKPHSASAGPLRVSQKLDTDNEAAVSAEVLSASKYVYDIRIRLQIGDKTLVIRHKNRLVYQVVEVDRRVVSRGPFGLLHNHHSFRLSSPHGEHQADLFIRGEGMSGINGVSLRLDGNEVLRQKVGWTDGLVGALGLLISLAMAAWIWMDSGQVGGPLVGLVLLPLIIMIIWYAL